MGETVVRVILRNDDEIYFLQAKCEDYERKVATLKEKLNKAEYLFRCESLINARLVDLCRATKVEVPRELYRRPY